MFLETSSDLQDSKFCTIRCLQTLLLKILQQERLKNVGCEIVVLVVLQTDQMMGFCTNLRRSSETGLQLKYLYLEEQNPCILWIWVFLHI